MTKPNSWTVTWGNSKRTGMSRASAWAFRAQLVSRYPDLIVSVRGPQS